MSDDPFWRILNKLSEPATEQWVNSDECPIDAINQAVKFTGEDRIYLSPSVASIAVEAGIDVHLLPDVSGRLGGQPGCVDAGCLDALYDALIATHVASDVDGCVMCCGCGAIGSEGDVAPWRCDVCADVLVRSNEAAVSIDMDMLVGAHMNDERIALIDGRTLRFAHVVFVDSIDGQPDGAVRIELRLIDE